MTLSGKGKDDKDDDNNNNQPTFDFDQFMKLDGFFRCERAAVAVTMTLSGKGRNDEDDDSNNNQPMFEFIQTTDLKNLLFVFIPVRMVQVVFIAGV